MDGRGRSKELMAIYYPPAFINAYLAEKVPAELGSGRFSNGLMKFFPASPTDIEALTETFPDASSNVFAVFDRMLKMRRSPFPHIKQEQLLYYFYKMAGDPVDLIETTQVVQDLLDREDESAQNLNQWIKEYQIAHPGTPIQRKDVDGKLMENPDGTPILQITAKIGDTDFLLPFFHKIRIYQLEETRDLIDFGTARTYAGNKIIIDYDWHKS
jgi:hypothetical protein